MQKHNSPLRLPCFKRVVGLTAVLSLMLLVLGMQQNTALMAAPAPLPPSVVAAQLQNVYEQSANFTADFRQVTSMEITGKERIGSGRLIFVKPGLVRWDYLTPDRQVLISDGKTLTMYVAKSNQMMTIAAEDYLQSDVSYSFFAGTGNIERDFQILPPDAPLEGSETAHTIMLIPKKQHPNIAHLYVWAALDSFLITRLRIIDHFDTVTDISFENIRLNSLDSTDQKMIADLFVFIPPPGTEIIEQ